MIEGFQPWVHLTAEKLLSPNTAGFQYWNLSEADEGQVSRPRPVLNDTF